MVASHYGISVGSMATDVELHSGRMVAVLTTSAAAISERFRVGARMARAGANTIGHPPTRATRCSWDRTPMRCSGRGDRRFYRLLRPGALWAVRLTPKPPDIAACRSVGVHRRD